jgi:hypothetical protein
MLQHTCVPNIVPQVELVVLCCHPCCCSTASCYAVGLPQQQRVSLAGRVLLCGGQATGGKPAAGGPARLRTVRSLSNRSFKRYLQRICNTSAIKAQSL